MFICLTEKQTCSAGGEMGEAFQRYTFQNMKGRYFKDRLVSVGERRSLIFIFPFGAIREHESQEDIFVIISIFLLFMSPQIAR